MRATTRTTRLAAYAASAGLALSGAVIVAPAQAAPVGPQPAPEAADWLADELVGGLMHNEQYGFDDYGLSIDTGLALAAVGGHGADVRAVSDAVAANIGNYVGTGTELYSGAAAKAAVMAATAGADPRAYGGVDLIDKVESVVNASGPAKGRLSDRSEFGDYANTLGQAFGAHALSTAGSPKADLVTDFLLQQQCSSGYFRLAFAAPAAPGQSCVEGTHQPNVDATALAVVYLDSQRADPDVARAIASATSWLATQQRCDGSFGGGAEGANANSTGLAAWALGDTAASRQAATWLRAHQVTAADSGSAVAPETGAIAYDDAGLAAGRSGGITATSSDQWRRATAQAAPGIAWFSDAPTPDLSLTGPNGYRKAGSREVLTTSGAEEGTVLCLTGPGATETGVAGVDGLNSTVTMPAGTRTRQYAVKDAYGHRDTTTVKVLGQVNLKVTRSSYRVKRARTVTATVRWLAPREWARIFYKGRLVRSGHASADGTFSATFSVGKRRGKKRIHGYGHFTDIRRGGTVIRVVR